MMSILCCCTALAASVICTRPSHVYTSREAAEFEVSADKPGSPIEVAFSRAYLAPFETFVTTTPARVSCALKEPGFIVCTVRERLADGTFGKPVRVGAGFDPTKIRTVLPPPEDYDAFWNSAFAEQDAIPADFTSKPLSNGVELVSCRTVWGTRMYGFLRIPKGTGPFPVQVMVWGGSSIVPLDEAVAAGASPEYAKRGFLFIHLPAWEPVARTSKEANARQVEWMRSVGSERAGLHYWNCEKGPRERWFYRCILGSCRLIDCVAKRPGVDPARIYYEGASTGGGYGVFLAAFSPHIRAAICEVPNYGNISGPSVGRPCGEDDRGEHWQTSLYYDTAYCAPRITCPVFMSAGYIDNSCCPETVYCIFNALTCPKTMFDKVENGHGDVPKGYREKRQAWLDGVLASTDAVVGQASSMETVRPRVGRKVASATSFAVRLARGERESFQVLVTAPQDLRDVRVSVSDGTCGTDVFAASNVACCVMGYVETVTKPPYLAKLPGSPTPGWWPDPILDFQSSADVKAGDVQSFWVRVTCPREQRAGTYAATLTVSAAGGLVRTFPLSVRVNDFAVPKTSPLPLAVTFAPTVHSSLWDHDEPPPDEKKLFAELRADPESPINIWQRHRAAWGDFLADYYLTPDSLYWRKDKRPYFDILSRLKDQDRLGNFNLGYWGYPKTNTTEAIAAWRDSTLPRLRDAYDEAKRRGLLDRAYLYGCDEIPERDFPMIKLAAETLKREFPGVPLSTTAYDNSYGEGSVLGLLDVFTPLTDKYDPAAAAAARARGREVWWYICCAPHSPYANMFIESPAIEGRLLMGAMTARYRPDGFLYYETSIWNARKPIAKGPFTDWTPRSWNIYNGDGAWLCVGPDGMPLATQRLENFRDGLEDFAYVKILEARLASADPTSPWARRARQALAVPCAVVKDLTHFTRDPQVLAAWRDLLADLIEEFDRRTADACLERIVRAVAATETRLPYLTATAEETVRRLLRNPHASIECPRQDQWGFSEEFWERAGGLRQIADGAYDTPDNIVLLSSRAKAVVPAAGKLVVRLEPVTGDPSVDLIADLVAGWMWCCEYFAACTRLCGRAPTVTRSLGMKDSWMINGRTWSPSLLPRFVVCSERIASGKLGRAYLKKALEMLNRMREPATRDAVRTAADYVARELDAGRTVGVAGLGHPIIEECVMHLRSNLKGIVVVGNLPQAYSEALRPGDTLVWLAYDGLDTYWADYGTMMRRAGLNVVLSHSGLTPSSANDFVKAFIPQLWTLPDAEVAIPVSPHAMAPLSAVSRCTLLRMLDAEVARTHPRTKTPPPDYGRSFFATVDYPKKIAPPTGSHRVWTNKGFDFEMNGDFRWALKGKTGFDYDLLRPLSSKLIAYERNGRFGLMAADGRELTPPEKELIAPYGGFFGVAERDYAIFYENGKYGKLDPETGKPLAEPMSEDYPK